MAWEQLLAIAEEARELARAERDTPPVACPNDGTVLQGDPDGGQLRCPWDGWTWPRDAAR